jgi:hypothetical protein
MIADELRRQADVFVDLATLSEKIARQHADGGAQRHGAAGRRVEGDADTAEEDEDYYETA